MATLATARLPLHADCVAFHPRRAGLLAAAGYQLDEATRTRAGGVWLFQCGPGGGGGGGPAREGGGGGSLVRVGGVTGLAGVFDAAWAPWGGGGDAALTLALADGRVECRALDGGAGGLRLVAAVTPGGVDHPSMALYVAHHAAVPGRTAVTLADGRAAVLAWDGGGAPRVAATFRAHALEAWTAAWCAADAALLYTGGDDAALAAWDVRTPCAAPAWRAPRGAHGAGVTAIAPAAGGVLATGSYDERVRVWDVRWPAAPTAVADAGAGGGAWRLAWRDARAPRALLAACMHASFAIARWEGGALSIVETYTAHGGDDLGYGAAWWVGGGRGGRDAVATASFYDNAVHLWQPATQERGE